MGVAAVPADRDDRRVLAKDEDRLLPFAGHVVEQAPLKAQRRLKVDRAEQVNLQGRVDGGRARSGRVHGDAQILRRSVGTAHEQCLNVGNAHTTSILLDFPEASGLTEAVREPRLFTRLICVYFNKRGGVATRIKRGALASWARAADCAGQEVDR